MLRVMLTGLEGVIDDGMGMRILEIIAAFDYHIVIRSGLDPFAHLGILVKRLRREEDEIEQPQMLDFRVVFILFNGVKAP